VSSFGTIRQRLVSGEPMPDGWVVHSETGKPINDPKKVGEGVLLPIGGYKGSGLALIIGLLAGVLNSAAFGRDVIDFTKPGTEETNTGQFIAAIDVSRFLPPEVFAAEVDRHMQDFKSSKRLPGVDAIRMPGEDRRRRRAERSKNGVALPDSLVKQLDDLAAKLNLTPFTAR
jgi:LDH2 family malate/lactate/ureidoglycolate dehydrogenase